MRSVVGLEVSLKALEVARKEGRYLGLVGGGPMTSSNAIHSAQDPIRPRT